MTEENNLIVSAPEPLEQVVIDQRWERKFRLLSEFRERHGHCNVPPHEKSYGGLLKWMAVQRTARKDGVLREDHFRRLGDLGLDWSVAAVEEESKEMAAQRWEARFAELLSFKERFGHCDVSSHWEENPLLANWVTCQRQRKKRRSLDAEYARRLEEAGFHWVAWRRLFDRKWERRFEELVDYKNRFGNCNVPSKWSENRPLGSWVHIQRRDRENGQLFKDRIQRLDEIGFEWKRDDRSSYSLADHWKDCYAKLVKFKLQHGHCEVPAMGKRGERLAKWVSLQRKRWREGLLAADRKERLDAIGFNWGQPTRAFDARWNQRMAELLEYKKRFGDCYVPFDWAENIQLGYWVSIQRAWRRRGKLTAERIRRLDEIGFAWGAENVHIRRAMEKTWSQHYAELKRFKKRFGHFDVPATWPENPRLPNWLSQQRRDLRSGTLSAEHKARLEEVGFTWERTHFLLDDLWERRFSELVAFKNLFGHCAVPGRWRENMQLANWVENQRAFRKRGKLGKERIQRLDAIGFRWAGNSSRPQGLRVRPG